MKKYQRLEEITKMVNQKGTMRISEIVKKLHVTDMTVRRDLAELEEQGVLTKLHGAARSNTAFQYREISHREKNTQNVEAKRLIAQKAASLIEEGDTIFLGPGTTISLLAEEITHKSLSIVTNCWPVFNILFQKTSPSFQVFLLGGEMREITESFVGDITNTTLERMHFSKMFFSANGVKGKSVMTSSVAEAYTQKLALSHSIERYLLIDSSKIGKEDFTTFASLTNITGIIMDDHETETMKRLRAYTEIIQ
ncbi:DeoR/GlpR family DNA-binding transcription regulator [Streptococcus sp. CSL10205-OR2]|uniref:DeoR/GlpR family DNA-binding transcription regulator n=1 Tax=Streptococcus sp. CSL10205-OR2 TaxID=2980558 RepID=UPI0021D9A4FA|nr:DeoR/GlpR family DNA-binding transcription regulator [Streptococcus sp. CSL10205-OR2]MCU9534340.1 DeoR/GlpR family DNA-binding transcription regulator [Streptococcus sp. CSL10205-OR2]